MEFHWWDINPMCVCVGGDIPKLYKVVNLPVCFGKWWEMSLLHHGRAGNILALPEPMVLLYRAWDGSFRAWLVNVVRGVPHFQCMVRFEIYLGNRTSVVNHPMWNWSVSLAIKVTLVMCQLSPSLMGPDSSQTTASHLNLLLKLTLN